MEKKEESYFDLQVDAPLFKELHDLYSSKENNWWQQVLNDKELYVNVRAGNYIDVYYRGAGVISRLEYVDNDFTCKIHKIYLGNKEEKEYETIEGEKAISSRIVEEIEIIKKNIDDHYHDLHYIVKKGKNERNQKEPPEGMSEKEIQGDMYAHPEKVGYKQQRYLDTEFVFVYTKQFKKDKNGKDTKTHLIIRIDFVTITNDGLIEFVELKRISDNRLLNEKYKAMKENCPNDDLPEICKQMKRYTEFIRKHKEEIVKYYKDVQEIMRNIGVNNPLANINIKGVKPEARLLFAPYSSETEDSKGKKKERIGNIKDLLESQHIESNIEEVLGSFLKKQPKK